MSRKTRRRQRGRPPVPPPKPAEAAAPAPGTKAPTMQDIDLKAAEAEIEKGLTPQNRANYMRVVVAGMQAAMAGGPNSIAASIVRSRDPVRDCAMGAVNLAMMLRKQSRDTMPVEALVPGAMTLMLHALDLADRSGVVEVGREEIKRAVHIYTNHLFNLFGITPKKLTAIAQRSQGVMKDPTQLDVIAKRAGVVRDPRASMMTSIPPGLINGGGNGGR